MCKKRGSNSQWATRSGAQAFLDGLWDDLRAGRQEMRLYTPIRVVWCRVHHAYHVTSKPERKPRGRGKQPRLLKGDRRR